MVSDRMNDLYEERKQAFMGSMELTDDLPTKSELFCPSILKVRPYTAKRRSAGKSSKVRSSIRPDSEAISFRQFKQRLPANVI